MPTPYLNATAPTVGRFADADEVMLTLHDSKGDQRNEGQTRNLFRPGEDLCPIRIFSELQRRWPRRWKGGAHLPLFRKEDGSMVRREDVVRLVRVSAEACGDDPSEVDGHSVRRGGATALFKGGVEFPRIMRFGRWHSDIARLLAGAA